MKYFNIWNTLIFISQTCLKSFITLVFDLILVCNYSAPPAGRMKMLKLIFRGSKATNDANSSNFQRHGSIPSKFKNLGALDLGVMTDFQNLLRGFISGQ